MKAAVKRIYKVTSPYGVRLIESANKFQAIGFVAKSTFKAEVATQSDLVKMTKDGIEVETVGGEGVE
jgi:hypothetical protein